MTTTKPLTPWEFYVRAQVEAHIAALEARHEAELREVADMGWEMGQNEKHASICRYINAHDLCKVAWDVRKECPNSPPKTPDIIATVIARREK